MLGPARSQLQFLRTEGWKDPNNYGDRYLRETMFGSEHPRAYFKNNDLNTQVTEKDTTLPGFGAFGTTGKHCFDPTSPAYGRIAALCRIRAENLVLRVGRQYQRQIRIPGSGFEFPKAGELVAWSRILDTQEAICIVNPNGIAARGGDVMVAAELWPVGTEFTVIANTAQTALGSSFSGSHPVESTVSVKRANDTTFIEIRNVPPSEVLVLLKKF